MDVSTSGENFNYTEVAGTGGLLIPNAVTLIKVERRRGRGGCCRTTGVQFNSERKKKKNLVIYLFGIQPPHSACNPTKLKNGLCCRFAHSLEAAEERDAELSSSLPARSHICTKQC